MVRTRADNTARKAVAAKAPRKVLGATSSGGAGSSAAGLASPAGKYAGGNAACPRPTPDWQKGIGSFLTKVPQKDNADEENADKENAEPADIEMGESSSTAGASCNSSEPSQSSTTSESPKKTKKNGLIDSDSDDD